MNTRPSASPAARLLLALMATAAAHTASAATVTKLDNTDNLNLSTSWTAGVIPGANDIALWDNTVTSANSTVLGANLTFGGIQITNPAGLVTIGAGNTLTLGTGGIDMSSASQDLTINAPVAFTAGKQIWNVATGRTLTLSAIPTKTISTASVVQFGTTGTIKLGTAASSLLTDAQSNAWATYGTNDWAALDATGKVIAATYTAATSTITTGVINDIQGNIGVIGSTALINALRFDSTTAYNVDIANSGTSRTATVGGILVTANSGGGSIGGNGRTNAFIRPNRSSGTGVHTFNVIQNSASDFTIAAVITNGSSTTATLVKSGTGKLILTGSNGYSAGTVINEGTIQVGNNNALGTLSSGAVTNNAALAFKRTDNITVANVISGTGSVTQAGSGELTLSGANTYTGPTNLNAGTIIINAASNIGNGTAVNFDGGTLKYGTGVTTDLSTRAISFNTGGATINTNGNNVTFANSVGNSGAGGLTKTGTGSLNLSAASGNTYSGNTLISGGSLLANNSTSSATGSGNVTVATGGTLGGDGIIIGGVTINSGGTLAPGNSVGSIDVGSLTLSSGSILNFEFNGSLNDTINVNTSDGFIVNGGGFNLFAENTATPYTTAGLYTLFNFSGTIGGTGLSALSVLNAQSGYSYTFGSTSNTLTLLIAASGVIADWASDADGTWGASGNWSPATTPDAVGASARFTSAATAPRTISLDGARTVGGLTFDNAQAYTIISGSGGSLTLDVDSGSASILVTNGNHSITAPVALADNVSANISTSSSLTLGGEVSGAQVINKSGAGLLDLTATNTYSGGTSVTDGTVGFSAGSLGTGGLTLDGGTLRYNTGNTEDISSRPVTIGTSGGTINTNGNDVTFANSIGNSGAGNLTKSGTGTLTFSAANTYGGTTSVTGGTLAISANDQLGAPATGAGLTLNGGTLTTSASLSLDSNGAGANARTVSVGASGGTLNVADTTTLTIPGVISGAGALTKSGLGTLSVSGANSYAGGTVINGGTVIVGGTGSGALGSGGVALNGATLNLGVRNLSQALTVTGTNNLLSGDAGGVSAINAISGSGTLNVTVATGNVDLRGDMTAFTGTLAVSSAFGNFRMNGTSGSASATFDLGTGSTSVRNSAASIALGALTGQTGSSINGSGGGATQAVSYVIGAKNLSTAFAGTINNGTGLTSITKVGSGTLTLSGANTYTGTTTISAGTLALGANDVFANTAPITLNGGTLAAATFTDTLGTLDLDANSSITFGTGGMFIFADSSSLSAGWGSFTLSISGNFVNASSIRFGTTNGGLTSAQLALININGLAATIDSNGYLSAIPEPSSFAALAGLGMLGFAATRRRRQAA